MFGFAGRPKPTEVLQLSFCGWRRSCLRASAAFQCAWRPSPDRQSTGRIPTIKETHNSTPTPGRLVGSAETRAAPPPVGGWRLHPPTRLRALAPRCARHGAKATRRRTGPSPSAFLRTPCGPRPRQATWCVDLTRPRASERIGPQTCTQMPGLCRRMHGRTEQGSAEFSWMPLIGERH